MILIIDGMTVDTKGRTTGNVKTKCPKCKTIGKAHLGDDLSVNLDEKVYLCHKCNWQGTYKDKNDFTGMDIKPKAYSKPRPLRNTELSQEHLKYFAGRKFSRSTIVRNKINSKGDAFEFPYFENGELINYKRRWIDKKEGQRQLPDGKPILYKLDDVRGQKEVFLTEGEWDCLSFDEIGIKNACSVNMGAPSPGSKVDKKLACIDNCIDVFENADTIYLAVDEDEAGRYLKEILVARFGADKCKIVRFNIFAEFCKDANEVLAKYGKDGLKRCVKESREAKDGISYANYYRNSMRDKLHNGQARGETTHFEEIDKHFTWKRKHLNVWTGYANEGKSALEKQLLLLKSVYDGWKHIIFSPEEDTEQFIFDLTEALVGLPADPTYDNCMNDMQFDAAMDLINDHFFFIESESDELTQILEKAEFFIKKNGCDTLTLDPYNQITHEYHRSEREDMYIGRFMTVLRKFGKKHNVVVNLVAHQKTPSTLLVDGQKQDYAEPNMFGVSGGAMFANKSDCVLAVWRPHKNTDSSSTAVKFLSQKIKGQKYIGYPGEVDLDFVRFNGRYTYRNESPFDRVEEEPNLPMDNGEFEPNEDFYNPQSIADYENESTLAPF